MTKSQIFKQAHALTRATMQDGDNYQATFALCLKAIIADSKAPKTTPPTPINREIFTRQMTDGSILVCKIVNNDVGFYINGNKIQKKSMVEICDLTDVPRLPKAMFERFKQAGINQMWNDQLPLFPSEVEAYYQAQEEIQTNIAMQTAYKQENYGKITLSSRGWGDYGNIEWYGDLSQADAEILAQCKKELAGSFDVDYTPNDDEIIAKIAKARQNKAEQLQERAKAQSIIDNAPEAVVKAYGDCGGNPDNLYNNIDHPLYFAVKEYAYALKMVTKL